MTHHIQQPLSKFIHIPGSINGIGRGVLIDPRLAKVLVEFAQSGHFHKQKLTKVLQGLTAGHDHQDNILEAINPHERDLRSFSVDLPGCLAKVVYHPDGNYYVYDIISKSEKGRQDDSTGLFLSENTTGRWRANSRDSLIPKADGTTRVAITDACEESDVAATQGAKALSNSDYVQKSSFNDFYMHHTHGTESITGYIRRKTITHPLSIRSIRESSDLLFNTMLQVRTESQQMSETLEERSQVVWISSRGGSAVLTQALYALKQRGISFHGHNHHIFFHEIGSDADTAVKLALELGFKMPAKPFTKRLWSMTSLAVGGGHKATNYRVKAEAGYTQSMAALQHLSNSVIPFMGILGAGCLLTGSAVAGLTLVSASRKAYAGVVLADSIASDVAGRRYDEIKRKTGFIK